MLAKLSTVPILLPFFVWLGVPALALQSLTPAMLQGTWKLQSLSLDGVPQIASGYTIFQGGHFSFITNRARPKLTAGIGEKTPEQLTEQEKRLYVEVFRNMTAAAGTFTVKGDEIIYTMEVARTPNLVGQTEERKSRFEESRLVQDFIGGGRRQVYVWERQRDPAESRDR